MLSSDTSVWGTIAPGSDLSWEVFTSRTAVLSKGFDEGFREKRCQAERARHLKNLQMTLEILEQNPDSLQYINSYRKLNDLIPVAKERNDQR